MPYTYNRSVRLADTDAAGVVYFANVLVMCHEAYEESLADAGINLNEFVRDSSIAIPIVHSSVDFFAPMFCGDKLSIELKPQQLSENEFKIAYQIFANESERAKAVANTKHVCINPTSRSRITLPEIMLQWLYF